MSIFDDLGKKISQTGQTAVQKTREMADIARINSMISDEEKKVNNNYFSVGKLYVAMFSANPNEEFLGMITSINESEKKVKEYRQQIQDIKGIQRCEQCGTEVVKGAAFCNACGHAMPKVQEVIIEDGIKCEKCGEMVKKGIRFCTSCGNPMSIAQLPSPEPQNDSEKTCSNCGVKLTADIDFCTECGTKI